MVRAIATGRTDPPANRWLAATHPPVPRSIPALRRSVATPVTVVPCHEAVAAALSCTAPRTCA